MSMYIKDNATKEYLQLENSMGNVAKFIAENEGKKIFIHKIDEQNENMIWVSMYEKSTRHLIPIEILEEKEDKDEDEVVEIIKPKKERFNIKKYIKPTLIVGSIVSILIMSIYIQQNKSKNETDMFEIYTTKVISIEEKIDIELRKQKKLRKEIEESIEMVRDYRSQKDEIMKIKIELAQ